MPRTRLLTAATAALFLAVAGPAAATEPVNNDLAKAYPISGGDIDAAYVLTSADRETGEPQISGQGETVWFKWKAAASGGVIADVCGAPDSHYIKAYKLKAGAQSVAFASLEAARAGDPFPLASDSFCRVRFRAVKDVSYWLQIDHGGNTDAWNMLFTQDTMKPALPSWNMAWSGLMGPAFDVAFKSAQSDVSFLCNLDGTSWQTCSSPKKLSGLGEGFHAFGVRAMDGHGNLGNSLTQNFKVDATGPATTITTPAGSTTVAFAASEKGTSECSVDGGAFKACASPFTVPALAAGNHTVAIRSKDGFGNVGAPATAKWTVAAPVTAATGAGDEPETTQPAPTTPAGSAAEAGTATTTTSTATTTSTTTTTSGTTTTTGDDNGSGACRITVTAPRKISRATLRGKGMKVKIAAVGQACAPEVMLEQRGRTLVRKPLKLGSLTLKARRARRGKATVVAGATKVVVKVV